MEAEETKKLEENGITEEYEHKERKIVVPGEILASGTSYLPGDNTARDGEDIISTRYGVEEQEKRLIRVIPISGRYMPRRGNTIIAEVVDITFNGWLLDINAPYGGFMSMTETRGYIQRNEDLSAFYNFGDMIVVKVMSIKPRGVDVTMRDKGLRKLSDGIIIKVNPNKVPRIIGKMGSMINIIKDYTGCDITVGQNGIIWIKGIDSEAELLAKSTIQMIVEKSLAIGLTEKIQAYLEKHAKKKRPVAAENTEEKGEEI